MSAPDQTASDKPLTIEERLLRAVEAEEGRSLTPEETPSKGDQPGKELPPEPDIKTRVPSSLEINRDDPPQVEEMRAQSERPDEPEEESEEEPEGEEEAEGEEVEASAEGETEEEEEEEAPEERGSIDTFSELAEQFEVGEDELLRHLTVADAEGNMVPLMDMVETHRNLPKAVEAKQAELDQLIANQKREHQETLNNLYLALERFVDHTEKNRLTEEEWARLKEEEPDTYLMRREEERERREAFESGRRALEAAENEKHKKQLEELKDWRAAEARKLIEVLPEWYDRDKASYTEQAEAEITAIEKMLRDAGFDDEQLDLLWDHRYMQVARNAMLYVTNQPQKTLALKKAKGTPKRVIKGRAQTKRETRESTDNKRQRRRLRQTGDVRDLGKILERHF